MHFRSMETDLDKKSFRVEDFQKLSFSDTKVDFVCQHESCAPLSPFLMLVCRLGVWLTNISTSLGLHQQFCFAMFLPARYIIFCIFI